MKPVSNSALSWRPVTCGWLQHGLVVPAALDSNADTCGKYIVY